MCNPARTCCWIERSWFLFISTMFSCKITVACSWSLTFYINLCIKWLPKMTLGFNCMTIFNNISLVVSFHNWCLCTLLVSTSMWETICDAQAGFCTHSKFVSKLSREPLSGISDQRAPPLPENLNLGRSGHFEFSLLQSTPRIPRGYHLVLDFGMILITLKEHFVIN